MSLRLKVAAAKSREFCVSNRLFASARSCDALLARRGSGVVMVSGRYAFLLEQAEWCPDGTISMSKAQRATVGVQVGESCEVEPYHGKFPALFGVWVSLSVLNSQADVGRGLVQVDAGQLESDMKTAMVGTPFNVDQTILVESCGVTCSLFVNRVSSDVNLIEFGLLDWGTAVNIASVSQGVSVVGRSGDRSSLFRDSVNFELLGIGGLHDEFRTLFRRAFVQRVFDSSVIEKLGVMHVKGIMLYGPPGTGKTLMARKIGSLLNARPPKIVNGPEILNKYVGQSEENIRNLFKDAEKEYAELKERSLLHIIIFDEIDAICKRRGSGGASGIGDQVVNQLLSKMDGVEALDNVLVIGITNRIDLIDTALLRPGRFEIHLEISLPDEQARFEILSVHTKKMAAGQFLSDNVDLREIAAGTRNYTGAEIAAVVKSAVSFALERKVKSEDDGRVKAEDATIKVDMRDFVSAIAEVRPAFGVREDDFASFGRAFYETSSFSKIIGMARSQIEKLLGTDLYTTSSVLLFGSPGTGKTATAVKAALGSGFPFLRLLSPKDMVGMSENEKVRHIRDLFSDAHKSKEAIVVLDDIEGLIEFVNIGPRFSNPILQALRIFVKEEERNKLFVIGTTSALDVVVDTGLYECFQNHVEVPMIDSDGYNQLCKKNEAFKTVAFTENIPIKKLLAQIEQLEQLQQVGGSEDEKGKFGLLNRLDD